MISGKTRDVVSGIRRWRTQKTCRPEARALRNGPSPPFLSPYSRLRVLA
jgi:hypothetical protein